MIYIKFLFFMLQKKPLPSQPNLNEPPHSYPYNGNELSYGSHYSSFSPNNNVGTNSFEMTSADSTTYDRGSMDAHTTLDIADNDALSNNLLSCRGASLNLLNCRCPFSLDNYICCFVL